MELPKRYDPKEAEQKWQTYWEEKGIFSFDPDSADPVYTIDTPPPTVSGKMHIGHAFSYTQQDFIARYKRMKGFNVFYPFGTDDNGFATERLIERTKKVKGSRMDRQEFIDLCLKTLKEELRPQFVKDWKAIGMSCDWNIFYSTIDEHSQRISQRSFLEMIEKGRIYRKESPIMICPVSQTAIAQVELEDKEMKSTMNYIKAKNEDGDFMIYGTTRPELLPACVGMSINKEATYLKVKTPTGETWIISEEALETFGERWNLTKTEKITGASLIGKKVTIPLTNAEVIVSHDEAIKTELGTGIAYFCTYGGVEDIEWLLRHPEVKPLHIMGINGRYNEKAGKYEGLNSQDARKEVLTDLDSANVLIEKEPITHIVNTYERTGAEIEFVATKQWFLEYLDMKEEFLKRGEELEWYPAHMKSRYDNWIKGLKWDWCLSRQRFSGVPIPVWYNKKTGEPIYPEESQLPVDPLKDLPEGYTADEVIPEKDILDTWATSSLTPKLAAEQFKDHPVFEKLLPMDLRPQGHDIITFWLFNTVVRSHFHEGQLPWKTTTINGWVLDPHGNKMSKSKGNVVAPQDMMEKYSADALRFWAGGSSLGDDLPFQEKDLVTGKKLVNKLWNATKFSIMHLESFSPSETEQPEQLELMDQWMLSKLNSLIRDSIKYFDKFEFSQTKLAVDKFFWMTLCDNYLEIAKDRLYNPDVRGDHAKESAQFTLYHSLLGALKILAPFVPHITEELYQLYFVNYDKGAHETKKSVHRSAWPLVDEKLIDEDIEAVGDLFVAVLSEVRGAKSKAQVSLTTPVKEIIIEGKVPLDQFEKVEDDLKSVTKAESVLYKELSEESEKDYICIVKF